MTDNNNLVNDTERTVAGSADISCSGAKYYEIHVKGQLDDRWSEWLEGLEVKLTQNEETILFGPIEDQAALMGVLNKLCRLNLTLLSLNEIKKKEETK